MNTSLAGDGVVGPEAVLDFWFKECSAADWFRSDPALDQRIRDRFLGTYHAAQAGETVGWRQTPRGRLAEVLVLDQFARNMFRGAPEAFAADAQALALAEEAVAAGDDRQLSATERHFLYMPYMHSESKEVQRTAIRLFWSLPPWKWMALWYAYKHKRIIDRFGRYPHRNTILGRESTPAELEFLQTHEGF